MTEAQCLALLFAVALLLGGLWEWLRARGSVQ